MFEITTNNGYVFCNEHSIPEEVLAMILSHVQPKELVFICRRVCKYWCNVIDSLVWRIKLKNCRLPPGKIQKLPWYICYWISLKAPFRRNLVKNSCGQAGLKYWDILSSGGDGWKVEKPPVGCENLPKDDDHDSVCKGIVEHNSCFSTSYYSCTKKQIIDLKKEGLHPEVMDSLQPQIIVSDWCCGRFDCNSIYDFKVSLLNEKYEFLDTFEVRKHVGLANGSSWQKVSHIFLNYGPGVKYIEFYHGGMDTQFWKGHYGSKMTGALVIVSL